MLAIFAAIRYTAKVRTGVYLQEVAVIGISMLTASLAFAAYVLLQQRTPSRFGARDVLFVGVLAAACFLFAAVLHAGYTIVADALRWITSARLNTYGVVAVVLIAGTILFFFRLKVRACYGLTEVVAGVGAALKYLKTTNASAPQLADSAFALGVLTAGVYLVVRGLDNIHQGVTRDPLDPMFRYVTKAIAKGFGRGEAQDASTPPSSV